MTSGRHRNVIRVLAVLAIIAVGGVAGWLVGEGGSSAEAAEPVQFVAASDPQVNPFTPPADVRGSTTVKGSGPFGGTGSDFVCDRERLIGFLVARPDRLRAWARVHALPTTVAAVSRYIRSLRPSTLLTPTRVTNYFYSDGRAVPFQAILAAGTAVLVDRQGAIRTRCRCGNPLLDPILTVNERCDGCPANYRASTSWQLASTYYALHPAPPPVKGEKRRNRERTVTARVVRIVPAGYVLEETYFTPDGKTRTRVVTVPEPDTRVETITRRLPRRTVTETTTRTVTIPVTVPRTVTRTVTVFEGN